MTTNERVERLQDLYASLGGDPVFTEHQRPERGELSDEATLKTRLGAVIDRMRERYGFRTSLDRSALVTPVRGYYAGRTDAELADRVDANPDTVARARTNLHLFRPADTEARFEVARLRRLLDDGASLEAFERLLAEEPRLLVEFYTRNCSKCGAIEPVFGNVAKVTDTPIALVNGGDLFELTSEYRIGSVPSLLPFEDGEASETPREDGKAVVGEEVDKPAEWFVCADGVLAFLGQ
jgi:thiol-disulfide isomerase/thioredoxin